MSRAHWRSRLEDIWYAGAPVPAPLAWLESLYRILIDLRRRLYAAGLLRSVRLPVPVVIVGNLTVGGTGKTPLVAALGAELRQRGWQPGIALRGYRGRIARACLLPSDADPRDFGDEAVLLARSTGLPVAIGRARAQAATVLLRQGCNVVVCDDGLQHWALARDLEVLVVDGERRFGNGRLLPAGPLREDPSRAERVDFTVVNGGSLRTGEYLMQVSGQRAMSLDGAPRAIALASLAGRVVHAVAGIGRPERFFRMLEAQGIVVHRHPYPDHHDFDGSEFAFGDDLPVLVTEKDAVKCARYADPRMLVVPVEADLPAAFLDSLNGALHEIVRSKP
jgi:tetraacyldisaccharide 4'-kinase